MKCFQCRKEMKDQGILINTDGDFICSEKCRIEFEQDRDYFFRVVIGNAELTEAWLLSE